MDPLIHEWLDLVVRWTHVLAAIAWVGGMIHAARSAAADEAPTAMRLNALKCETLLVGVTGVALLALVFYAAPGVELFVEPGLASLGGSGATLLFAALVLACWLFYDALFKSPLGRDRPAWAIVIAIVAMTVVVFASCRVMPPRAAFVHVGALLGSLMAANVLMVIVPNRRRCLEAVKVGQMPDGARANQAKIREAHNMCLALPVVFMMMSKGFASTWRASAAWLILSGLILVGLLVGHWLLLRWRGDAEDAPWILPVSAALMIALFFVARVG